MAKAKKKLAPGVAIAPKKKCCRSRPRCKRCRVTLDRLRAMGFAQPQADGRYLIVERVPKRELKAARGK